MPLARHLWVAVCVTGFCAALSRGLGVAPIPARAALVFAAAWLVYRLDDAWDAGAGPRRAVLPGLVALSLALVANPLGLGLAVLGGLAVCSLYGAQVFPGLRPLKRVPGLKSPFVAAAITVAGLTVALWGQLSAVDGVRLARVATAAFATTLVVATFLDSMDRDADARAGVRSLATLCAPRPLAMALVCVSVVPALLVSGGWVTTVALWALLRWGLRAGSRPVIGYWADAALLTAWAWC